MPKIIIKNKFKKKNNCLKIRNHCHNKLKLKIPKAINQKQEEKIFLI